MFKIMQSLINAICNHSDCIFFSHVHACTYTLTSFKAIYVNAHEFKNVLVSNK